MLIPVVVDDERIERLKAACFERGKQGWLALSSTHFLDAYLENLDQPPLLREALALENKLANQDIGVYPDELIVGRPSVEALDYDDLYGVVITSARESLADQAALA